MSEDGMLYLIMVVAIFVIFIGTLMWKMIETSPLARAARERRARSREDHEAHGSA